MDWDWSKIEHPLGLCVHVHNGLGPETVRIGNEDVTNCLACITNACDRQKLKWKQYICDTCKRRVNEAKDKEAKGLLPSGV